MLKYGKGSVEEKDIARGREEGNEKCGLERNEAPEGGDGGERDTTGKPGGWGQYGGNGETEREREGRGGVGRGRELAGRLGMGNSGQVGNGEQAGDGCRGRCELICDHGDDVVVLFRHLLKELLRWAGTGQNGLKAVGKTRRGGRQMGARERQWRPEPRRGWAGTQEGANAAMRRRGRRVEGPGEEGDGEHEEGCRQTMSAGGRWAFDERREKRRRSSGEQGEKWEAQTDSQVSGMRTEVPGIRTEVPGVFGDTRDSAGMRLGLVHGLGRELGRFGNQARASASQGRVDCVDPPDRVGGGRNGTGSGGAGTGSARVKHERRSGSRRRCDLTGKGVRRSGESVASVAQGCVGGPVCKGV
ncbi:hypothetical protein BDN71DRAFT_1428538 [Pleurotus eryngii]|uniref:Uncharacterized protein n=1 Tax=Pleurotus eryngii TaxID=5323 RepID=A0A9P6DI62_PLEER|nr:hypothetical protein BDN71DRAFT_1428538 [Pleurotus eryngii]